STLQGRNAFLARSNRAAPGRSGALKLCRFARAVASQSRLLQTLPGWRDAPLRGSKRLALRLRDGPARGRVGARRRTPHRLVRLRSRFAVCSIANTHEEKPDGNKRRCARPL